MILKVWSDPGSVKRPWFLVGAVTEESARESRSEGDVIVLRRADVHGHLRLKLETRHLVSLASRLWPLVECGRSVY